MKLLAAVSRALTTHDLDGARVSVSKIVGRDTAQLDDAGGAAAVLESLAESFNDGVVAPVFWLCLSGLPGLFIYKAMSAAGSLIGHKEPRWRDFGWGVALIDDVLNLVPARMPEASNTTLAGPATYDGAVHGRPTSGSSPAPQTSDLSRSLTLYIHDCGLMWLILAVGGVAWRL